MCGIAGGFVIEPTGLVHRERVERMSRCVSHRGPDGDGVWTDADGRVCLAHRRLAVIDLVTGHQPMVDPETGAVVVFNGEIYNYRELRAQMARQGEVFRSESDTEVLLRLYLREGCSFVRKLRGMFAFALWDPRHKELVVGRDRIGKKPFFWSIQDGCFYFASTFRALRSTAANPSAIHAPAVLQFLDLGYVPAPGTVHPQISKLPPGTVGRVGGQGLNTSSFWDPGAPADPFEGTWDDAVDTLDALITRAVELRLRSDVPLGVFLSGGIDSSLVAAVATRISTTPIHTFSMGFDDVGFNETPRAVAVSEHLGTAHESFRTRVDMLGLLPALVRHFGEPFADSSAIPTWLLAEQARKRVTVALGGDGGDEAYGGYDWYRNALGFTRVGRGLLIRKAAALGGRTLAVATSGTGTLARMGRGALMLGMPEAERFAALRTFMDPALAESVYAGELKQLHRGASCDPRQLLVSAYKTACGSALQRMRYVDIKTYLADCLMPKLDVATMAHGLEGRSPLLDHEVVEFAARLPDEWITDARTGKLILRAVLERYLPRTLFDRPKQGFDMPLSSWFTNELRPRVRRIAASDALVATGWFRPQGLQALVDEHFAGRRDHNQRIYSLFVLDEWLRQN